ncbi:hypothetical protein Rhal01_00102 [Rubritalea halochordaticola]|uniref:BD-FAE-like domain-containing protein n=1 Tax=Rubritalea halochordaticola TaxID=714537 RepID=A0ABP9UTZ6_9BACT
MPVVSTETYSVQNGEKLLIDIYGSAPDLGIKSPAERKPAVLCLHGGGWEYGSKDECSMFANTLAAKGYVVFAINYRLAGKDHKNVWPAQLDDAQTAVRWIRHNAKKFGVDPGRIAASGASAGGHLSNLLGLIETRNQTKPEFPDYSSKVNCVITYAGPTDLTEDFRNTSYLAEDRTIQDLLDQLFGKKYGTYLQDARKASPLYNVSKNASPHLLIHSKKDEIVSYKQTLKYNDALTKAGVPCKVHMIENTGHIIKNPLVLITLSQRVITYLDEQFKNTNRADLKPIKSTLMP